MNMNRKPQTDKSEGNKRNKGKNTEQVNSVLAEWMSRGGNFQRNNNSNISLYFPKKKEMRCPPSVSAKCTILRPKNVSSALQAAANNLPPRAPCTVQAECSEMCSVLISYVGVTASHRSKACLKIKTGTCPSGLALFFFKERWRRCSSQ